jgi:putative FmdB family regulatory protein
VDSLPIYEYRCSTCGQNFDVTQRMSDDALTECTVELCVREDGKAPGGGEVSRVLFAPAIHFKGTGFHNTDYASKSRGGADSGSEGGSKNGSGDGGEKSSSDKSSSETSSSEKSSSSSDTSSSKTVGLDKV